MRYFESVQELAEKAFDLGMERDVLKAAYHAIGEKRKLFRMERMLINDKEEDLDGIEDKLISIFDEVVEDGCCGSSEDSCAGSCESEFEESLKKRLVDRGYWKRDAGMVARALGEEGVDLLLEKEIVPHDNFDSQNIFGLVEEAVIKEDGIVDVINRVDDGYVRLECEEGHCKRAQEKEEGEDMTAYKGDVWKDTFGEILLGVGFLDRNGLGKILNKSDPSFNKYITELYNLAIRMFRLKRAANDGDLHLPKSKLEEACERCKKLIDAEMSGEMSDYGMDLGFLDREEVVLVGKNWNGRLRDYVNVPLESGIVRELKAKY